MSSLAWFVFPRVKLVWTSPFEEIDTLREDWLRHLSFLYHNFFWSAILKQSILKCWPDLGLTVKPERELWPPTRSCEIITRRPSRIVAAVLHPKAHILKPKFLDFNIEKNWNRRKVKKNSKKEKKTKISTRKSTIKFRRFFMVFVDWFILWMTHFAADRILLWGSKKGLKPRWEWMS